MNRYPQREFYRAFFRDCYLQSGWIPVFPFGHSIANGDVFQIQNGQRLSLLNIQQLALTDSEKYSELVHLREQDWPESFECVQTQNNAYTEQTDNGLSQIRQQSYSFQQAGAYLFSGRNPQGRFMLNWHKIVKELIVKLTQSKFTFQEVYVVTDIANIPHWGLAIAAQANASLQLVAASSSGNCLFDVEDCQMSDSSYLSVYQHSHSQPLFFFRAKKLVLSAKKHDHYLKEMLHNDGVMSPPYHKEWLQTSLLNLASSNELNITSCTDFFDWQDVGMDEVVKLVGY